MERKTNMTRRSFIAATAAISAAGWLSGSPLGGQEKTKVFEVTKTEDEWKTLLTPAQFRILRKHDTERAGSSPLDKEHRKGTFHCAGCDLPLFRSEAKFDSRTGWPSFTAPIDNAIGTSEDRSFFSTRTEVHCRRCGGHLGHVFDDGPAPTGLRYCMNGGAMTFRPAEAGKR